MTCGRRAFVLQIAPSSGTNRPACEAIRRGFLGIEARGCGCPARPSAGALSRARCLGDPSPEVERVAPFLDLAMLPSPLLRCRLNRRACPPGGQVKVLQGEARQRGPAGQLTPPCSDGIRIGL